MHFHPLAPRSAKAKTRPGVSHAGGALVISLLSLAILAIVGAHVLTVTMQRLHPVAHSVSWRNALAGAESGVETARQALLTATTDPTAAWATWTPTGTTFPKTKTYTLTPPSSETGRYFATDVIVKLDAPAGLNPSGTGSPWYRVFASGTAEMPPAARTGVDGINLALRQVAFAPDATHTRPRITRTVGAVLKPNTPFGLAIHARDRIEIKKGKAMLVDSWNSSGANVFTGTAYSTSIANSSGNIATNATGGKSGKDTVIRIEEATIKGGVFKGGGVVDTKKNVLITGGITDGFFKQIDSQPTPNSKSYTTQASINPGDAKKGVTFTAGKTDPVRLSFSTLHIHDQADKVYLKNPHGTKAPIQPSYIELYVSSKFKLHGGASITSDPGVYVTLYTASKDVTVEQKDGNGGFVNGTGRAEFLNIISTLASDEKKDKKKKGKFKIVGSLTAAVFAPDHDFEIKGKKGNTHFYGSLVGNKFKIDGDTKIHYDESLDDVGPISGYKIVSWLEDWVPKGPKMP